MSVRYKVRLCISFSADLKFLVNHLLQMQLTLVRKQFGIYELHSAVEIDKTSGNI